MYISNIWQVLAIFEKLHRSSRSHKCIIFSRCKNSKGRETDCADPYEKFLRNIVAKKPAMKGRGRGGCRNIATPLQQF